MRYIGLQAQKSKNNAMSLFLLCLFPALVLLLVWVAVYILFGMNTGYWDIPTAWIYTQYEFINIAPYVIGGVAVWFLIAYFANTAIISRSTHSRPLERMENKRVYNIVENLCISQGMPMPKVNVIDYDSLNAFASGINKRTYTVTLTSGIIRKLNDEELEAVVAHELSHIRNHDVRLLIVSIVFVGIFAMIAQIATRSLWYMPHRRSNNKDNGSGTIIILVIVVLSIIGYFFSTLLRFAISRKREYLADAGSAEMTKNPLALASALRKISADPDVEAITQNDVAQLFIEHPHAQAKSLGLAAGEIFATHPPIEKRIKVLEQF